MSLTRVIIAPGRFVGSRLAAARADVHLIARGNTLIQILNGAVTSIVVDDDTQNRSLGGLLGFQMHVGQPMKVEFRNIWLKKL